MSTNPARENIKRGGLEEQGGESTGKVRRPLEETTTEGLGFHESL